jgi:hypothetical protein
MDYLVEKLPDFSLNNDLSYLGCWTYNCGTISACAINCDPITCESVFCGNLIMPD